MDPIFPITKARSFVVLTPFEAWRDGVLRTPQEIVIEAGDILHIGKEAFYIVRDERRIPVRFDQPSASELFRRSALYHPRVAPPLESLSEIGAPTTLPRSA